MNGQQMLSSGDTLNWTSLVAGFVAVFFAGIFACKWMITLVKKSKLTYFAIYCLLAGAAVTIYGFQ